MSPDPFLTGPCLPPGHGLQYAADWGTPGGRQTTHHRTSHQQDEPAPVQDPCPVSSETLNHPAATGKQLERDTGEPRTIPKPTDLNCGGSRMEQMSDT